MKSLVHLVHPYVYKLQGDTFMIGPIEAFRERDLKVAEFLRLALDLDHQVLHHRHHRADTLDGSLCDVAFKSDPIYGSLLFDSALDTIVTTSRGTPFPDERPEQIPLERWEIYMHHFTTDMQFKEILKPRDLSFFIGGCLDACLANAMGYFNLHHRLTEEKLFYVPELCVTLDETKFPEIKEKLDRLHIYPLIYAEAKNLLKND